VKAYQRDRFKEIRYIKGHTWRGRKRGPSKFRGETAGTVEHIRIAVETRKRNYKPSVFERICVICGNAFISGSHGAKYCYGCKGTKVRCACGCGKWVKLIGKLGVYQEGKGRYVSGHYGQLVPDSDKKKYQKYRNRVVRYSERFYRELFDGWNGRCRYSGKRLIPNEEFQTMFPNLHVSKNRLQPTVDHIVSIAEGFSLGIPFDVTGSIRNLCICSREMNSSKGKLSEVNFALRRVEKHGISKNLELLERLAMSDDDRANMFMNELNVFISGFSKCM